MKKFCVKSKAQCLFPPEGEPPAVRKMPEMAVKSKEAFARWVVSRHSKDYNLSPEIGDREDWASLSIPQDGYSRIESLETALPTRAKSMNS
jgi:hypothetical protein